MFDVILNKNEEINILNGVPFIYNNEISKFNGEIESGKVCRVLNSNNEFVCYGFFNSSSKIMVRVLSLNENDKIDYDFFYKRIKEAISLRESLSFDNTCRLIFSEADFLPGLVVDKYADILVCQFTSLGMFLIKEDIKNILVSLLNPRGIYMRNDTNINLKEGISLDKGFLYNEFDTKVLVKENDIKFYVDVKDGQKTGYFLDQKLNRDNLKYYVKDKVVLDCFSHTGGFALNAIKNGAKKVLAVDISEKACNDILNNAKLNDFTNLDVCCDDVFEFIKNSEKMKEFDVIVLDPPAFTKSKETVKSAYKGYKKINKEALLNIKKGGYLLTFSCSGHMTMDLFFDMLKEAVSESKRRVQMIDFRIQSPDHPTLLDFNSLYLKCVILRVLE